MTVSSDEFPGVSGRRLCRITNVLPQTRVTWVQRNLLATKAAYGQVDVVEQVVLKELLSSLPKGDVSVAWEQLRPTLRDTIPVESLTVVWDPTHLQAQLTADAAAIGHAVRHGRPSYAIPVGEAIVLARSAYKAEAKAFAARRRRRPRAGGKPRSKGA